MGLPRQDVCTDEIDELAEFIDGKVNPIANLFKNVNNPDKAWTEIDDLIKFLKNCKDENLRAALNRLLGQTNDPVKKMILHYLFTACEGNIGGILWHIMKIYSQIPEIYKSEALKNFSKELMRRLRYHH
ncbi:uncharacterized protein LOC144411868 [Styela clava]